MPTGSSARIAASIWLASKSSKLVAPACRGGDDSSITSVAADVKAGTDGKAPLAKNAPIEVLQTDGGVRPLGLVTDTGAAAAVNGAFVAFVADAITLFAKNFEIGALSSIVTIFVRLSPSVTMLRSWQRAPASQRRKQSIAAVAMSIAVPRRPRFIGCCFENDSLLAFKSRHPKHAPTVTLTPIVVGALWCFSTCSLYLWCNSPENSRSQYSTSDTVVKRLLPKNVLQFDKLFTNCRSFTGSVAESIPLARATIHSPFSGNICKTSARRWTSSPAVSTPSSDMMLAPRSPPSPGKRSIGKV
mmetsp:Transcript_13915/g.37922  ORF Transcript_13915/g.37922 Transcript_13915/m.37922 type:complete len:301 (+) Transcript_13915:290-1192(+)